MIYKDIISDEDANKLLPYDKCIRFGASYLSDEELLAAILRTGASGTSVLELSKQIIDFSGGLAGLYSMSSDKLENIKGIGKAKSAQIQCILELSKRINRQRASQRLDFSNPDSIADYYMESLRHLDKEHLVLVMLDSKCCLIRDKVITVGTINSSLVSTRDVFIEALKAGAVSIILLHNHPSGNPEPSSHDIKVTENILDAGRMLGINLLDHIIIGDNLYFSFKRMHYINN